MVGQILNVRVVIKAIGKASSNSNLVAAYVWKARLAQSVERKALNLVVVGSSPTVGVLF